MNQTHPGRIQTRFAQLKSQGRTALIPYIVAGDPAPEWSAKLMHALVEGGADLLEFGVPFSDPEADGPDLQAASERALAHGINLKNILEEVARFRRADSDTPVILMGYLNPIERMGYAEFASAAQQAGVDGLLVVNMPPEEAGTLQSEIRRQGLDSIYLLAPTTTDERALKIANEASGFLYYVSLRGTTGSNRLNLDEARARLIHLRSFTELPLAVGFGISDGETVRALSEVADAVVVGAVIARQIAALVDSPELIAAQLKNFMAELRAAADGGT